MQQHIVIKAMLGACIRPDRRPRVPLGCRPRGGRGRRGGVKKPFEFPIRSRNARGFGCANFRTFLFSKDGIDRSLGLGILLRKT